MPINRNALIRYRTIDCCLQNRYRKWTLDDLIDACSEALYEYEGIDKGVSRRTVQMDIQLMRSEKLGYEAPIIVVDKKYYTYQDPNYSITNIPLTAQDLGKLNEVVEMLKQFKGFTHFQDLAGMVQKLEDKIDVAKSHREPIIDFEKNEGLWGLTYIETLYQAISDKKSLHLTYQSFKARNASKFIFYPYLLKEYRNRWFLLGMREGNQNIQNLALDRIQALELSEEPFEAYQGKSLHSYFQDVIGVTITEAQAPENVILFVDKQNAPYVLTKPLHHSQELVEKKPQGIIISLQVQLNFELEREILGFGEMMCVIAPPALKRRIKERHKDALDAYMNEIHPKSLHHKLNDLHHRGSSVFNYFYSKKEINQIKSLIHLHFKNNSLTKTFAIRALLQEIPRLKPLIFNHNLYRVVKAIDPNAFLVKGVFFDKTPEQNWYVTWHQDLPINLKKRIETEGFTGWTQKDNTISACPPVEISKNIFTIRIHLDDTDADNGALKVILGSHHQKHSDADIQLITQNAIPFVCEVALGGVHILRPLILHSSSKSTQQEGNRGVIHLEFCSLDLPNGLEWAEKITFEK